MVDEVQLCTECRVRLRCCDLGYNHFLLLGVPAERVDRRELGAEVVGEYGVSEYGGLELGIVEECCTWRKVWVGFFCPILVVSDETDFILFDHSGRQHGDSTISVR